MPSPIPCFLYRFMGRPAVIGVPDGLDITTVTAKITNTLIKYQSTSLADEVPHIK